VENNENQASLAAVLFVLKRRMAAVCVIGVAVAMVFALVTAFFIPPKYASTAKFYVNNTSDQQSSPSSQDINASKSLAESSIVIVKNSTALLERIIEKSGVDVDVETLRANITAGTYSRTEAFYISVEMPSASAAYKLAYAFYEILPDAIPESINVGEVSPFDVPLKVDEPVSPSIILNTIVGGVLGIAVAFLVFFLKEVLDNTIYTEEDIRDKMGYPVIGLIPTIVTDQPQKSSVSVKLKRRSGK